MCGIVGFVGKQSAWPIILEGLKTLEYRGYDSAGVALLDECGQLTEVKKSGELSNLARALEGKPIEGTIGIGHTRWATHGEATETNAHPHRAGRVAVVHNGIIENYAELRQELERRGRVFKSETDTEVVPHLIDSIMDSGSDPIRATQEALKRLQGSFALGILFEGCALLIATRRQSPLVVGLNGHNFFISSDQDAFADHATHVHFLDDGELATLRPSGVSVFDSNGAAVATRPTPIVIGGNGNGKGAFRHYMLKEIHEQPKSVGETLRSISDPETLRITLPELPFDLGSISRLSIVACGTASHAGLVGRYWFEGMGLPVDWDIASEFRYREIPLVKGQPGLFLSQSGETADTLEALRKMKNAGHPTVGIVNKPNSTMQREADCVIPTLAHPEIGVASTKAYTAQLGVLSALAYEAGCRRGTLSAEQQSELLRAIVGLPHMIQRALLLDKEVRMLAATLTEATDVFYVGRGTNYCTAMEGALKLKEISYIHAEAFAAGELKHGPLALITKDVPVIVIAPRDRHFDKTCSNLQEIAARGGRVIMVTDDGHERVDGVWRTLPMPKVHPMVAPILYAVPMQLLAYYTAVLKGANVDRPRNLAKSVTVE